MQFSCPRCKQLVSVKEEYSKEMRVGVFCPSCNQLLRISFLIESLNLYNSSPQDIQQTVPIPSGGSQTPPLKPVLVPIDKKESIPNKEETSDKDDQNQESLPNDLEKIVQKWIKEKDITLPILPKIKKKAMEVTSSPELKSSALIQLVQTDQVLAAAVIRLANSLSPDKSDKVDSLAKAAEVLGPKRIHKTILHVIHSPVSSEDNVLIKDGLLKKMWIHNLASAMGSKWLSKKLKILEHDKIFLAALLHDIGKIIILQVLSELKLEDSKISLPKKKVIDFISVHHPNIGAEVLKSWNFPPSIVKIVRKHHDETNNQTIQILKVTDLLCKKLGLGLSEPENMDLRLILMKNTLELDEVLLAHMEVELENLMMRITKVLE